MDTCPCGIEKPFSECCEPVIKRERVAVTAEELMRSRYSAYATGDIDWIIDSHHPDTVDSVDRHTTEHWSNDSDWLGLTINDTEDGGADDDSGAVSFRARYRQHGQVVNHDEMAYFTRVDGDWRFHSVLADPEADIPDLVPVTASAPAGRNDPCPCGSGRKYKKCCGAA